MASGFWSGPLGRTEESVVLCVRAPTAFRDIPYRSPGQPDTALGIFLLFERAITSLRQFLEGCKSFIRAEKGKATCSEERVRTVARLLANAAHPRKLVLYLYIYIYRGKRCYEIGESKERAMLA